MTFSRLEHINVRHLTTNQPFCAGVVLLQGGKLVVTLNAELATGANKERHTTTYRIGGVGGGQEPGETIWECATREAYEELGTDVHLHPSPVTYFHDRDDGETYKVSCADPISPFLLERQSNLYPYTPFKPGLPSGQYTYFSIFLAEVGKPITHPGDVEGLLFIPLNLWLLLQQNVTLEKLLQQGATLIERHTLTRTSQLCIHPWESFNIIVSLLQNHPELLR